MVTKEEIINRFEFGKRFHPTDMILFYDSEEKIWTVRYVKVGEDSEDIIINKLADNRYKVIGLYSYSIKIEDQLSKTIEDDNKQINYDIALKYATEKHKNQYRKSKNMTKPYIMHPIGVSQLIEKYMKYDYEVEKYKIAALLHDTLEDTSATYEELKDMFSEEIANIILSITNNKKKIKKQGKDVYLANKMLELDDKVLILKLCDRLDNIGDLSIADKEFKKRYIRETLYIINYLLLNRKLNRTQLVIINDIFENINEILNDSNINYSVKKNILKYE